MGIPRRPSPALLDGDTPSAQPGPATLATAAHLCIGLLLLPPFLRRDAYSILRVRCRLLYARATIKTILV